MQSTVKIIKALKGICFFFFLFGVFWLILDLAPPGRFGALKDTYVKDSELIVTYNFRRLRTCDVTVHRQLIVENVGDTLPPVKVTGYQINKMEEATPSEVRLSLPWKDNWDHREITLRTVLDYECNPLHKIFPLRVVGDYVFIPKQVPNT